MSALYIYELNVTSSYLKNIEYAATEERFDTVQWWINENSTWRIRLFDDDCDIHVHKIAKKLDVEYVHESMVKKFNDVIVGRYDFINLLIEDSHLVVNKMKSGFLEISQSKSFAFWNHGNKIYKSQSEPK